MAYTINIKGKLMKLDIPVIMGILNVTPDSFFASSRVAGEGLATRAKEMIAQGASILDIGACATVTDAVGCTDECVDGKLRLSRIEPYGFAAVEWTVKENMAKKECAFLVI